MDFEETARRFGEDAKRIHAGLTPHYGWTFLYCPQERIKTARFAVVGLNPGGGARGDAFTYPEQWECRDGNAYFQQNWGASPDKPSPMQIQVREWHHLAGVGEDDSLCAQLVPFRSRNWKELANKGDVLEFSRALWTWVLSECPARTYVAMGQVAGAMLADLLQCSDEERTFRTGWGGAKIHLRSAADGRRVVIMPHPSRYRIFCRPQDKDLVARASYAEALTVAP